MLDILQMKRLWEGVNQLQLNNVIKFKYLQLFIMISSIKGFKYRAMSRDQTPYLVYHIDSFCIPFVRCKFPFSRLERSLFKKNKK